MCLFACLKETSEEMFFLTPSNTFKSVFVCVSGCMRADLHCKQYQLNKKEKNLVHFEQWGKNEYELQEINIFKL